MLSPSYSGTTFVSESGASTPQLRKRQPAFQSRRVDLSQPKTYEPFYKTPEGRRSLKFSNWIFIGAMSLGILGLVALCVTAILDIPKHKYCLVLDDNFDTLDTSVWTHEQQVGGFGNKEFQWTTDSSNNSFVEDGMLYIVPTLTSDLIGEEAVMNGYTLNLTDTNQCTALDDLDGPSCGVFSNSTAANFSIIPPIVSARLTTNFSRTIRYGRVEVTARMPTGDWLWPAIWMLPKDSVYGSWPQSGEIDIMEGKSNQVTKRTQENNNAIRSTLHWGPSSGTDTWWKTTGVRSVYRNYFNEEFKTFGLEWDEKSIWVWEGTRARVVMSHKFNIPFWEYGQFAATSQNGTAIANPWSGAEHPKIAPFDQDFYLILNVAVGGSNGYFDDKKYPNKPWSNNGLYPVADFWRAKDQWLPSWPEDPKKRGMAVDRVRMWQQCD